MDDERAGDLDWMGCRCNPSMTGPGTCAACGEINTVISWEVPARDPRDAEIARLRAALTAAIYYADHEFTCAVLDDLDNDCDCGLVAGIAEWNAALATSDTKKALDSAPAVVAR